MEEKFLMVCLGNICRSPIAHGVLEHKAKASGLNLLVDSAGTANYHVGEKPDARMRACAKRHGFDIDYQRARQFQTVDFDKFDHVLVMDASNYKNVAALARNEHDIQKIHLFLDFAYETTSGEIVPDPYYGDDKGFDEVCELVEGAVDQIIARYVNR